MLTRIIVHVFKEAGGAKVMIATTSANVKTCKCILVIAFLYSFYWAKTWFEDLNTKGYSLSLSAILQYIGSLIVHFSPNTKQLFKQL